MLPANWLEMQHISWEEPILIRYQPSHTCAMQNQNSTTLIQLSFVIKYASKYLFHWNRRMFGFQIIYLLVMHFFSQLTLYVLAVVLCN